MTLATRIRSHRDRTRARREFNRAVTGASTIALRDELITMDQARRGTLR